MLNEATSPRHFQTPLSSVFTATSLYRPQQLFTDAIKHVIILTVICLLLCQQSTAEILSRSTSDSDLKFNWGQSSAASKAKRSNFRSKRDSSASGGFDKLIPCDPVGWLNWREPKFECNAWARWGLNISSGLNSTGKVNDLNQTRGQGELNVLSSTRQCVPLSRRCDFVNDCPDGSDEYGCYQQFCDYKSDFVCEKDLTCVPHSALCDGRYDCHDQSDENAPHVYCHLWGRAKECEEGYGAIPCDGKCIPNEKLCDGRVDCSTGIDESYAACNYLNMNSDRKKHCGLSHFECWKPESPTEPSCIERSEVCDTIADCLDGSDETQLCDVSQRDSCQNSILLRNCRESDNNSICRIDLNYGAKQINSSCIYPLCTFELSEVYSDDSTCEPVCPDPLDRVCLWNPSLIVEEPSKIPTYDQILQCVPNSAFCNSSVECRNEADELLCAAIICDDPSQFHCGGLAGQCISTDLVCNGFPDCWNATDEQECTRKEIHCNENQFYCPDHFSDSSNTETHGRCVDLKYVCEPDLVPCLLDEGKLEKMCNENCTSNPNGANCKCNKGYEFDDVTKSCVDIDECNVNASKARLPCDQICTNFQGWYQCSCHNGYYADPDDSSRCVAVEQNAYLLVTLAHLTVIEMFPENNERYKDTDPSSISNDRLALDKVTPFPPDDGKPSGSTHQYLLNVSYPPEVAREKHYISFAAFDYHNKFIYFADPHTYSIYRTTLPHWNWNELLSRNANLTNTQVMVNGSGFSPKLGSKLISEGMAVDYSSGNIYWVERDPVTQIHVSSPDFKHDVALIRDRLHQPRELSLHVPKRLLFWVDWGEDVIERCNFDGSDRRIIIKNRLDFINSVAADEFSDRVYFLDARHDEIRFSDLDGKNEGYVLRASGTILARPFSLTMFESALIWSDWGRSSIPKGIHKCNKRACHLEKDMFPGQFYGAMHLTIIHKTLQDLTRVQSSSCLINNGQCGPDSLCVPFHSEKEPDQTNTCFRRSLYSVTIRKTDDKHSAMNCSAPSFSSNYRKVSTSSGSGAVVTVERCFPTAWPLLTVNETTSNNGTLITLHYWCYCGPPSGRETEDWPDDEVSLPLVVLGVMLAVVFLFLFSILVFFYCRNIVSRFGYGHHRDSRGSSGNGAGSTGSQHRNPGCKYGKDLKYAETAFTSSSNPLTEEVTAAHGPPPESPLYSPGVNAFEWEEAERQKQQWGGGEVFDFTKQPQNYDAYQPQGSQQQTPFIRRPSVRSALPSIKEDPNEEDEEEAENEHEGAEDLYNNSSSTNSNGRIPRNHSVGSSTAGLVYPSDDEVFDNSDNWGSNCATNNYNNNNDSVHNQSEHSAIDVGDVSNSNLSSSEA